MMYLKQFPDICREMGFDVEEKAKTITLSLRYTLYDGGYNFATLLYAVYSDVNGWTVQMEKE